MIPFGSSQRLSPVTPMYKRKKKLINRSLQLKMIGVFTAIGCTCALFQVVLLNFGLLELARESGGNGVDILKAARGLMFENMLWTFGALIPLMTCVGLVITHRVAGPAYRMTEHCKAIAAGGEVRPCKVRDDDELQDLCEALNGVIAKIPVESTDEESASVSGDDVLESTPAALRSEQSETSEVEVSAESTSVNAD